MTLVVAAFFIRLVVVGDKVAKTVIFWADKAFFVRNPDSRDCLQKKRHQAKKGRFYAILGFPPQEVYYLARSSRIQGCDILLLDYKKCNTTF
jgi:hypothetical protein